MIRLALVAALIAAPVTLASAGDQVSAADHDRARAHFDRGQAAYAAGDYRTAIEAYIAAYRIEPFPELVFDIGQAHRLAGNQGRALEAYRMYLEEEPDGPLAAEARAHVLDLENRGVTASEDLRGGGAGAGWSDFDEDLAHGRVRDAQDDAAARAAFTTAFGHRRQRYLVGAELTFMDTHQISGDGRAVALVGGLYRRITDRVVAKPRVAVGTVVGVDAPSGVYRLEAVAAFAFRPLPWLSTGAGLGFGWSSCTAVDFMFVNNEDMSVCHGSSYVTGSLDVGVLIADRYDLDLRVHLADLLDEIDLYDSDGIVQPLIGLSAAYHL